MNNIAELQNKPAAIEKLVAQRYLYSQVKKVFFIHSIIAITIAILFPILGENDGTLKPALAIIAIIYLLIEMFILDPWESSKKELAARIQELFDFDVLKIKWNPILVGTKPDQESIGEYQGRVTKDQKANLYNWYPVTVSSLPHDVAQIICQRANIWWDSTLRRKFMYLLIFISIALAGFLFWQNRNITLINAVINMISFAPLFQLLIKQVMSHRKSANRLDYLKDNLNSYLDSASSIPDFTVDECTIRSIQDEIFRHRSSVQSVPDFFYNAFQSQYEDLMNFNAEKFIEKVVELKKN
jgi:hypothetical protein